MAEIPKNLLRQQMWGHEGRGNYVLVNIFDTFNNKKNPAFFTLAREDKGDLVSFPRVFIAETADDPTEYSFAIKWLGEWDHWEQMCQHPKVKPIVEKLRKERDMLIKSRAVKAIFEEASNPTRKNHFSAAKLLADRSSLRNSNPRPTKAEETYDDILADALRLGIGNSNDE